jgi:hypothetical protein
VAIYRELKKAWRSSRKEFDSMCNKHNFIQLI